MTTNRFSPNGDGRHSPPPPDDRERRVVSQLSTRYKELTSLWEEAEERLRKFHIPVDVHVRYKSEDVFHNAHPTGEEVHSYLGFVRWAGSWRICHCLNHDGHPESDFEWKPVTDCRLDVRLEAIPYIDKLHEVVVEAAEQCVPKLDEALATFREKLKNW